MIRPEVTAAWRRLVLAYLDEGIDSVAFAVALDELYDLLRVTWAPAFGGDG